MSGLSKLAPRPPFANYDIVVYFGTGLFSLPILQHFYLIPLQMKLRSPLATTGDELIDSGLSILIILFLAYLIGHGLAYASGQLIQKAADGVFGKTSGAIIWESLASDSDRNKRTRELIRSHLGSSFKNYNWFANFVRAAPHIPVLPIYWAIYRIGIFGFYGSRVPSSVVAIIRKRLAALDLPDIPVAHRGYWFKPLEHFVMNNYPIATSRMYNYLVISGLFRSLSLIFLIIIWFQAYYDLHFLIDGDIILQPILSDGNGAMPLWQLYIFLMTLYFVALFSFLKFQRRYVEEAMFAFALTKDGTEGGHAS